MGWKGWIQESLLKLGYELRKFPVEPFSPVPVFDLALELLMARKGHHLTFVQVGANDGIGGDPINRYITRFPWRGILVEPQPSVFERLCTTYGAQADRLIFENVAISPEQSSMELYRVDPTLNRGNHSFVVSADAKVTAEQSKVNLSQLERFSVPALSLTALLAKHRITDLDLLQIDVEGYDWQVLRSLDLAAIRPTLIQLEHGHLSAADCDRAAGHLSDHDYKIYWGGYQADTLAIDSGFFAS